MFQINEEAKKKIYEEFNRKEEIIGEDVETIKNWLKTQPHLPEVMEDAPIKNFLHLSNFSVEKTKRKIDMYYTIRSLMPEFYITSNPKLEKMQLMLDKICVGITSEDHARITRNKSKCIKIYCNDCNAVDIRSLLLQLSKKIETLENKISNQTSLTETSQLAIEKVTAEAVERITRAKNIIVHGVAELSGNPKEQQKQDENTAKELTIVLP
ncbi:hypothetical protein Zmor_022142 [Zophobas morio]|uniref:Uncharacterized protein n=1 Tax=Zophobas morio TaxID=2755281 RepID=A0AA38M624_9CUCU|nr:hypothetical protein Zmor_022142 [Zophobas morio]